MTTPQPNQQEIRTQIVAILAQEFMATSPEITSLTRQLLELFQSAITEAKREMVEQPTMQKVYIDEHNTARFKANKIVQYLLDNGGIDMNMLATIDFTNTDREQFAQLIGYSVSGYGELSYVSDESYERAEQALTKLTNEIAEDEPK